MSTICVGACRLCVKNNHPRPYGYGWLQVITNIFSNVLHIRICLKSFMLFQKDSRQVLRTHLGMNHVRQRLPALLSELIFFTNKPHYERLFAPNTFPNSTNIVQMNRRCPAYTRTDDFVAHTHSAGLVYALERDLMPNHRTRC